MYYIAEDAKIKLSIVEDFTNYILNIYNFSESEKDFVKTFFYDELSGEYKFKNDSSYIISSLIDDSNNLSNVISNIDFTDDEINKQLKKIIEKINFKNNTYKQIEELFINNYKLEYYKEYIDHLK
jgi:hypothetical protein